MPTGDNIHQVQEELKKAAAKHGDEAKEALRTALAYVEATTEHLKAQLGDPDEKRKIEAQHQIAKLQEMADTGRKTLEATGEEFRKHLDRLLAEAKSAIDARKS